MRKRLIFFIRSNVRESSENESRQSGRMSDGRSVTGEPGFRSGQLDTEEIFPALEPNDILDLPRVRHTNLLWSLSLIGSIG